MVGKTWVLVCLTRTKVFGDFDFALEHIFRWHSKPGASQARFSEFWWPSSSRLRHLAQAACQSRAGILGSPPGPTEYSPQAFAEALFGDQKCRSFHRLSPNVGVFGGWPSSQLWHFPGSAPISVLSKMYTALPLILWQPFSHLPYFMAGLGAWGWVSGINERILAKH